MKCPHPAQNPLAAMLATRSPLILDGALATELERRGCNLNHSLWSARVLIETPELIKTVHAEYFAAGADCAITATYQATFEGFERQGIGGDEALELLLLAVRLAVEARDEFWADPVHRVGRPRPIVAASIGPYGAYLADGSEYSGDYAMTEADLKAFHRPRMRVLAAGGADILACETIPSLVEAQALTGLLTEFPDQYAWMSFSARDAAHTSHGERLADCAAWLDPHDQIAAVGVNCTHPRHTCALIDAIRSASGKPVVVYPNSGETYHPSDKNWTCADDTAAFAAEAREWYRRGAQIIGGCCRTTPDDIRALATWARPDSSLG